MSTALSATLYLLAIHPHIQEKVREEVKQIVGENKTINLEIVNKLVYTELTLKECMRIIPPTPIQGRRLGSDLIYGIPLFIFKFAFLNIYTNI